MEHYITVYDATALKNSKLTNNVIILTGQQSQHTMCGSNHAVAFLSSDCEAIISQLQLRSYSNIKHQTRI